MNKWACVVVALVFSACEPMVEVNSYCGELARAKCEAAQRCGTLSVSVDCSQLEVSNDCIGPFQQALDEKRLHFDAARAQQCVDDVREAACMTGFALNSLQVGLCRDVFVGDANEGEPCGRCAAGLFCSRDAEATNGCGVCRKFEKTWSTTAPTIGEVCTSSLSDGLGCRTNAWCTAVQDEQRCVARSVPGEACSSSNVCVALASCVDDVCVLRPTLQESCENLPCQDGLACVSGVCELRRTLGSACTAADQCNSQLCLEGACAPLRSEGEACAPDVRCQLGLNCENAVCIRVVTSEPQCRP